jgi:hypothetical protein
MLISARVVRDVERAEWNLEVRTTGKVQIKKQYNSIKFRCKNLCFGDRCDHISERDSVRAVTPMCLRQTMTNNR